MNDRKTPRSAGFALRTATLLALLLALMACAKKVEHPPLDVTFLPERGDFIDGRGDRVSMDAIMEMAKDADYILVGEGHRNACDHAVQQKLLAALAASGRPPAVGLEMVAVDMQPVLDDFGQGMVPLDELAEELQWKTKWGYPFGLFRGLFEIAQRHSLPVAGLNTPSAVTRKISREGLDALTDEERAMLPQEIVPPAEAQIELLDGVFEQHSMRDHDDPVQRERFRLVQSIWDSKMAEEAVRLRRHYDWPVFIVAGSGHVEHRWGIARRIERFDPSAKILNLMPRRGGEFIPEAGDVFFHCPDVYVSRMGATLAATGTGGLLVEAVGRGSRADESGLRPGDLLLEAADVPLVDLFHLHIAGSKVYKSGKELVFTVRRGGDEFEVSVGKLGQNRNQSHTE